MRMPSTSVLITCDVVHSRLVLCQLVLRAMSDSSGVDARAIGLGETTTSEAATRMRRVENDMYNVVHDNQAGTNSSEQFHGGQWVTGPKAFQEAQITFLNRGCSDSYTGLLASRLRKISADILRPRTGCL